MISFQVEKWSDVRPEMEKLFPQHWEEIALSKGEIRLSVDYEQYAAIEKLDRILLVTVRDDGKIIGYYAGFITSHLHYKETLFLITDLFYVLPEYRKGRTGAQLIQTVEAEAKKRGVVKMVAQVKLHSDVGPLFEYLGWTPIERVYSKLVGG